MGTDRYERKHSLRPSQPPEIRTQQRELQATIDPYLSQGPENKVDDNEIAMTNSSYIHFTGRGNYHQFLGKRKLNIR